MIVDGDVVDITNINRQLPALHSTVGQPKVTIVGDRLMDINPELKLTRLEFCLQNALATVTDY
jgi:tRNA A37 threonylcarbamoyladenosine dehydratase